MPFIPFSTMSTVTRSGLSAPIALSAPGALSACPQTFKSGSWSNSRAKPSRKIGWSSTSSRRRADLFVPWLLLLEPIIYLVADSGAESFRVSNGLALPFGLAFRFRFAIISANCRTIAGNVRAIMLKSSQRDFLRA